tara:strand:+ start:1524 stop:2165 length:642 start_codon:yes stop_codon:yes gene_type:complete
MAKKATNTKKSNAGFLPEGFEMPATSGDNYMKFEIGETTFRIISKPLIGWLAWADKKPHRFASIEAANASDVAFEESPRYFWAVIVWNSDKGRPQILEITQKTVLNVIHALNKNPKWGAPFSYDLTVEKTGSGKDGTKYATTPNPKEKLKPETIAACKEWTIELENLFTGGDPFTKIPASFQSDEDDQQNVKDPEAFEQELTDDGDVDDDLPF